MNEDGLTPALHKVEQLLIGAARADAPPNGARDRAIAGLGISASVGLAGARAAAASAAAKAVAVAPKSGLSVLFKALVIGALGGGIGMAVVTHRPIDARHSISTTAPSPAAVPRAVSPVPAAFQGPPPEAVLPEATRGTQRVAIPRASGTTSAEPAPPDATANEASPLRPDQVAAERTLLDGARKSLSAGRASTALKTLTDYEQRFGFGILGDEEQVLRVEALMALGRRPEAVEVGEHYLTQRPHGTQAPTIKRLLASDQNSKTRP